MERQITWTNNGIGIIEAEKRQGIAPAFLAEEVVEKIAAFHRSVPGYEVTPLTNLSARAKKLGLGNLFVKDESHRFGLNAFKGLGGVYAVSKVICEKLGLDLEKADFSQICSEENKEKIKDMVFITATDGNHGKGVAWAAKKFGCQAYVYMPKGTVESRVQAIRDVGATEVLVTDYFYDDTVRMANKRAEENGWTMVQDTAWEGYEKIPTYIVQGYTTLAKEAVEQLKEKEPDTVACIFESAKINDGKPHASTGSCETVMAGLNCAEPCLVTYPTLRDFPVAYAACPDFVTEEGMWLLGKPLAGDDKVISGESGAVGMGLLYELTQNPDLAEIKARLGLNEKSVVLLISTEGNTDPDHYAEVLAKETL